MIAEFLIAVGLIATVLLLPPKGEGMGSIGGQARVFSGAHSLNSGLDRVAIILASLFVVLALVLSTMN